MPMASSGMLVPRDTTVTPVTIGAIPSRRARPVPPPNQELGSTYEADETGDDQYGV